MSANQSNTSANQSNASATGSPQNSSVGTAVGLTTLVGGAAAAVAWIGGMFQSDPKPAERSNPQGSSVLGLSHADTVAAFQERVAEFAKSQNSVGSDQTDETFKLEDDKLFNLVKSFAKAEFLKFLADDGNAFRDNAANDSFEEIRPQLVNMLEQTEYTFTLDDVDQVGGNYVRAAAITFFKRVINALPEVRVFRKVSPDDAEEAEIILSENSPRREHFYLGEMVSFDSSKVPMTVSKFPQFDTPRTSEFDRNLCLVLETVRNKRENHKEWEVQWVSFPRIALNRRGRFIKNGNTFEELDLKERCATVWAAWDPYWSVTSTWDSPDLDDDTDFVNANVANTTTVSALEEVENGLPQDTPEEGETPLLNWKWDFTGDGQDGGVSVGISAANGGSSGVEGVHENEDDDSLQDQVSQSARRGSGSDSTATEPENVELVDLSLTESGGVDIRVFEKHERPLSVSEDYFVPGGGQK
jgi:hypothetical protein